MEAREGTAAPERRPSMDATNNTTTPDAAQRTITIRSPPAPDVANESRPAHGGSRLQYLDSVQVDSPELRTDAVSVSNNTRATSAASPPSHVPQGEPLSARAPPAPHTDERTDAGANSHGRGGFGSLIRRLRGTFGRDGNETHPEGQRVRIEAQARASTPPRARTPPAHVNEAPATRGAEAVDAAPAGDSAPGDTENARQEQFAAGAGTAVGASSDDAARDAPQRPIEGDGELTIRLLSSSHGLGVFGGEDSVSLAAVGVIGESAGGRNDARSESDGAASARPLHSDAAAAADGPAARDTLPRSDDAAEPPRDEHGTSSTRLPADGELQARGPQDSAPRAQENTEGDSTGEAPHFLLYIPQRASPFPFSFLYDATTGLAWPIVDQPSHADAGATTNVLGAPFHLSFTMRPTAPPEQPDVAKAAAYVNVLEHVDAALRERMARLQIGDIGLYGTHAGGKGILIGCAICLDVYPEEDRPAWFVGEEQKANECVVAVPCPGFHTMHASYIRGWLEATPPSRWTCPYCRAPLPCDKDAARGSKRENCGTLCEYVRDKERSAGWRCDAPACLPCYMDGPGRAADSVLDSFGGSVGGELVEMLPCHHMIHLDCLYTCMRVENTDPDAECMSCSSGEAYSDDGVWGWSDEQRTDDAPDGGTPRSAAQARGSLGIPATPEVRPSAPRTNGTVGKWVMCAACRKDAWAYVPTRRRPQRSLTSSAVFQAEGNGGVAGKDASTEMRPVA
ncbi:RING-type E3 ubiquitin transferase [Malassezia sp. CBS 17886]|nr:RING-type E3 ubiquitin transferase [Malassezia sp. CBS 17886]